MNILKEAWLGLGPQSKDQKLWSAPGFTALDPTDGTEARHLRDPLLGVTPCEREEGTQRLQQVNTVQTESTVALRPSVTGPPAPQIVAGLAQGSSLPFTNNSGRGSPKTQRNSCEQSIPSPTA